MRNRNDFDLDLQKVRNKRVAEPIFDLVTEITTVPCKVGGATVKISLKNKCKTIADTPTTGFSRACCHKRNEGHEVQCI